MMTDQYEPPVLLGLYQGVIAFDQWTEVQSQTEQGLGAGCMYKQSRWTLPASRGGY